MLPLNQTGHLELKAQELFFGSPPQKFWLGYAPGKIHSKLSWCFLCSFTIQGIYVPTF